MREDERSFKVHAKPLTDRTARPVTGHSGADVPCGVLPPYLAAWPWMLGISAGICSGAGSFFYDGIQGISVCREEESEENRKNGIQQALLEPFCKQEEGKDRK